MSPTRWRTPVRYTALKRDAGRSGAYDRRRSLCGELTATLVATTLDHSAARAGAHPHPEAVLSLAAPYIRLIRALHAVTP
jgi:hypothetical protein